jgi:GGDEF domain-containing protein
VISLKKFLAADAEDAKLHSRLAWLILEAVSRHAVVSDPLDQAAFQVSLREIVTKMEESSDAGILAIAGEATKAIEAYNRGVQHSLGSQKSELHSIVSLFTRSMLQVSKGSTASSTKLRQIERQIEKASQAEDLRTIKAQLQQSLDIICEEAAQQERRAEEVSQQLRDAMSRPDSAAVLSEAVSDLDLVTGLSNFRVAEQAIRTAIASGTNCYAALLCVERVEVINSRFGFPVGDRILMLFGQHLAQHFSESDRLFRWRGPGFLAILNRTGPEMSVRAEIARIVSTRLEQEIELSGRYVLLPIGSSWMLMNLANACAEEVTQQLDRFSAQQAGAAAGQARSV